jgi:hypothetical protein
MKETWLEIKGYEGLYLISNMGRIKSLPRNGTRTGVEYLLKPELNKFGYNRVVLSKNDKPKRYALHRLVAFHFIPNSNNFPQINHINAIRNDNRASNLEWVTSSQNRKHALKIGSITSESLREMRINQMQAVIQYDKNENFIRRFRSISEASDSINRTPEAIGAALAGRSKTSGGYIWKYE